MVTVQGVVDRVGPTMLRAVHAAAAPQSVTDVVIAEPGRRNVIAAGDLVLGVAVGGRKDAVDLIRHSKGAAGVLLKQPQAADKEVLAAAEEAQTAIVEVRQEAAWAQLVWLLRAVLDAAADDESDGDVEQFGDLFRLADAVAAVIDAPVTIEDANSRVLAYSTRQDRTDPARVSTIMGRRVPDDVLARFRSRGVFRQLSKGRSVIFVPAQRDGTLPRLIVPIRMGGELLGSMWAVVDGEVSDERSAAFADTGPVVALHLLRRRARVDAERMRSAELVRAVLSGATGSRAAAAELGLDEQPHRVIAIDAASEDAADAEGVRLALWERMTRGVGRRPAVADLHGVLYAVVPDKGWSQLRAVLATGEPLVAAGSAVDLNDLPLSRSQADETLALLRTRLTEQRLAGYEEVWSSLVLHRVAAASMASGVAELGPLNELKDVDRDTLYQWLRHPGDPREASRALRIHPNTFRYRMKKIGEVIDLDDPDVRLALLAQLVTLKWA
ncbi:MAG TPA: helix-turn-helix domain-containing protein [Kutzneria sp.]|jgi:GTP-sensing pleiotropic transcriptional regulator CodY